ncbi:MAG: hypothetical protein ABIH74_05130 [Candidatus Omnitrophota bacterium]
MSTENTDYEALKKRGFLRSKHEGYFTLRTRIPAGNYTKSHLKKIAEISEKYGKGTVHLTVRQGIEIPFIKSEDIDRVEREIKAAGIFPGTSGARLRVITCCPGNNWCKQGLVNTFSLLDRVENDRGIRCGMDLPHKFKIAVSGCPNACTRVQSSEVGVHGEIDTAHPGKKAGYAVYLGGNGGRIPREGFKLDGVFTEDAVLVLVEKAIKFYKENAKPRQRFGSLIEETGREDFLRAIGESRV